jgi:regulator of protease activity HflC (stomatin/prohibitin superfamily)
MAEEQTVVEGTSADSGQVAVGSAAAQTPVAAVLGPAVPQLVQVRVPLDEAAEAMATPDSTGRLPIVVVPAHPLRIRNELVIAGAIVLVAAFLFNVELVVRSAIIGLGVLLVVLGVFQSFLVPVPMGTQAVLLRRGKFYKTVGPGTKILPPWIPVSHIVTTRETPFDSPAISIPTKDNVRTSVDILLTFTIAQPEKFVFVIAAPDFDQVCQATCQEAVRRLIREKDSEQVLDMGEAENEELRAQISAGLGEYGIEIVRVLMTHIVPPMEFQASREARRLTAVQRAEQKERHGLALLRQADQDELRRQQIAAQKEAIELQAANEVTRLERLESRLREYPNAISWDVESKRLEVARALAANTRAMVQVGPGADVAASLLMHTLPDEAAPQRPGSSAARPKLPATRDDRTSG